MACGLLYDTLEGAAAMSFMSVFTLAVFGAPIKSMRAWIVGFTLLGLGSVGFAACTDGEWPEGSDPAPDASTPGPLEVASAEYRFDAALDPEVLPGYPVEIWAKMTRPRELGDLPHPLIVFLHGNHQTCARKLDDDHPDHVSCLYTFSGSCPAGQQVVPNHIGFDYLADLLASWGYVVVSINANRGITCGTSELESDPGLIMARGRLVLRHLALLSQWHREGGAPASLGVDLQGKLDVEHIGLLGHSRGGPGMRAAYNLYRDPQSPWPAVIQSPLGIDGIFEIGPTDAQEPRVLDAVGTAWNALLPMCDGDVGSLSGMRPFDRMLEATSESPAKPKSTFAVWGTNHNFFNSQWQHNESEGCARSTPIWEGVDGPARQRGTAVAAVLPFFRAHVGRTTDPGFSRNFDPRFYLPDWVTATTQVDRAFVSSPSATHVRRVESFKGAGLQGTLGFVHEARGGVAVGHVQVPEHDAVLRAARVEWQAPGQDAYFQNVWSAEPGLDLTDRATLDFRVSCANHDLNVRDGDTDFDIQLVFADGKLGPAVSLSEYVRLNGPDGETERLVHSTLKSVRIPLTDLGAPAAARGVRFTFNRTSRGVIYLSDVSLSAKGSDPWDSTLPMASGRAQLQTEGRLSQSHGAKAEPSSLARAPRVHPRLDEQGRILNKLLRLSAVAEHHELVLESADGFPVRSALPVLLANGQEIATGSIGRDGDLRRMTFRIRKDRMAALPARFEMQVGHREDPKAERWDFGSMDRPSR